MTIVAILEFGDGSANVFHVFEDAAVDRLFLQAPVETFGHAIGLWLGNEGETRSDTPEFDLVVRTAAPAELVAFVDGDPFGALWLPDAFIDEARRHAQSGAEPAARNEALLKEKEAWIADGKQVKDFLAAKAVESKVGTEEIRRRIKAAVSRRGKPLDNSEK